MHPEATERELFADDMRLGATWALGLYTVTEDEIVAFASQWDPQFFHVDRDRATDEGSFGGIIASGVQTLAIYQRLSVLSRIEHWQVVAGAGINGLRFRRPVRPGDTLTGQTTVENVRFEAARHRGLVTYAGLLTNQNGEKVLTLTMSAYLRTRAV